MLTCYSNISDSFCEAYLALTKIHSFTSPTKILFFIEGGGGGGDTVQHEVYNFETNYGKNVQFTLSY